MALAASCRPRQPHPRTQVLFSRRVSLRQLPLGIVKTLELVLSTFAPQRFTRFLNDFSDEGFVCIRIDQCCCHCCGGDCLTYGADVQSLGHR